MTDWKKNQKQLGLGRDFTNETTDKSASFTRPCMTYTAKLLDRHDGVDCLSGEIKLWGTSNDLSTILFIFKYY